MNFSILFKEILLSINLLIPSGRRTIGSCNLPKIVNPINIVEILNSLFKY